MYSLDVKSNVIHTAVILKVMTSIVHGQIDISNPFDLRFQSFRVNVKFSTDYHGPLFEKSELFRQFGLFRRKLWVYESLTDMGKTNNGPLEKNYNGKNSVKSRC